VVLLGLVDPSNDGANSLRTTAPQSVFRDLSTEIQHSTELLKSQMPNQRDQQRGWTPGNQAINAIFNNESIGASYSPQKGRHFQVKPIKISFMTNTRSDPWWAYWWVGIVLYIT